MFKVLIVDDEPIVKEGLKTIIDWEAYGYSICGDAGDGGEAIEKLAVLRPDVAIVDIRMPEVDGFAVSEYVRNKGLSVKIVFLTGYDEFKYARRAIGLGVKAYLLKPVDEDDLIDILLNLRREIEIEERNEKLVVLGEEITYCNLMKRILNGENIGEASQLMSDLYHVALDWRSYQVALVCGYFPPDSHGDIKQLADDFLRRNDSGIVFWLENQLTLIVRDQKLTHEHPLAQSLYKAIRNSVEADIQMILSDVCSELGGLPALYQQAVRLMNKGFLLYESPIVDTGVTTRYLSKYSPEAVKNITEKLAEDIRRYNEEAVLGDIESIKGFLIEFDIKKEDVYAFYTSLLVTTFKAVGTSVTKEGSFLYDHYTVHRAILALSSIEAVEEYVKDKILGLMHGRMAPIGKLHPILEYIKDNTDKDIKLKTLAIMFNYNSAYLGKMIKEHTGISFNEYMDQLKMEKAQSYIQDGCMVYEAAKMVGYTNINYFNLKFKKYTGISPGAVRKSAACAYKCVSPRVK